MAIRYSNRPMGYSPDAGRFSNNAFTGKQHARFPAHARPIDPCRPDLVPTGAVKIYAATGEVSYGWNRSGNLKRLEPYRDAGGVTRWQERGDIFNAVAWST